MNIFYLDDDIETCARYHNDRHVIKMIVEYSQLLSTAHRLIDGNCVLTKSKTGRNQKIYLLPGETLADDGEILNQKCCKNTHANHPSAVWVRESDQNYNWLFSMLSRLTDEWRFRYGHNKAHKIERYFDFLSSPPRDINKAQVKSKMALAMPEHCKISDDPVECYRFYYKSEKSKIGTWKNRPVPTWFSL